MFDLYQMIKIFIRKCLENKMYLPEVLNNL